MIGLSRTTPPPQFKENITKSIRPPNNKGLKEVYQAIRDVDNNIY
jgi:hypothetical protein